ncbi:Sec63 [Tulasnella sp. JGI-2019a]|nr:Sec63 [Tulasnella sp. JGI-2019a]
MAPTKALCTEKFNDWTSKFQHVGVKCCEFTGDTVGTSKNAWKAVQDATIIVTTASSGAALPEKWDSLTRNWRAHQDLLAQMQLFLVDEVHILNESRGSTLEVCVSRMKTRGTSVRFILLSATAPNIDDIAAWVGNSQSHEGGAASMFKFGEEYRPCKITRTVYAYPQKQQNAYQFSRALDFKLFELLQRHGDRKPALIFCPTRKGVVATAEQVAKDYIKCLGVKGKLPWPLPARNKPTFHDNQLAELYTSGLGVHHAGLTLDDRRTTEELFLSGDIRVLVATSTLAVGVNLPAHTVIIKGTQMWAGIGWAEYSEMDAMQMIGRAGRPQFDTEGLAIILCTSDKEQYYRAVSSGNTLIESSLHLNLTEHLNSEIGLGTISDLESAKAWLRNSYFFQRLQKNPARYDVGKLQNQTWQDRLDELVDKSVKDLSSIDLVRTAPDTQGRATLLAATEYGEIMSRYYIRYTTMGLILQLPDKATLRDILETISQADEFSDVRIRGGDKQVYNTLRAHMDMRMPVKKVEKSMDKVMILIQAVLGGISLNAKEFKTADSQPHLEALGVLRHASRIARAIVDIAIARKNGSQAKYGLELARGLGAKAWDDRPIVMRQISQIGEKSIKVSFCSSKSADCLHVLQVLTTSGVTSIAKLRAQEAHRLELLLNRKPPFGTHLLTEVAALPQYTLRITEDSITPSKGSDPVKVVLVIEVGLSSALASGTSKKRGLLGFASLLTITSDHDFVDFRRLPVYVLSEPRSFSVNVELAKASQSVIAIISSENHAGLSVVETYKPSLPPGMFPTLDTRPRTEMDAELDGVKDVDPEFWVITKDDFEDSTDETNAPHWYHANPGNMVSNTSLLPALRLPNGHFQCNHTCKDKQNCRHLCCKDGALRAPVIKPGQLPSKMPSASSTQDTTTSAQVKEPLSRTANVSTSARIKCTSSTQKGVSNNKSNSKVREHAMQELSALQRRTNVTLSRPEGRRISLRTPIKQLASVDGPNWLRSPKFTQLEDETPDQLVLSEDDEDILPDIFEDVPHLAKPPKKSVDGSDYDDPEFDALLADASPTTLGSHPHGQPAYMTSVFGIAGGAKRSREDNEDATGGLPKPKKLAPMGKGNLSKVFQSPLRHRSSPRRLMEENRPAPRRDTNIAAAIREKPLFLNSSSPISGDSASTADEKAKAPPRPYTPTLSRTVLSPHVPSALPQDETMEVETSQPFGTLADFSFDPALFELEGDPTAADDDEECDKLIESDVEGEEEIQTATAVRYPAPAPERAGRSRDNNVVRADTQRVSTRIPPVIPTMPSDQMSVPLSSLSLPPAPKTMIAPGVERTGNEAVDDFFDWMYNSGQVEILDS